MNVQTRLVAEHHLDAPWRPRDLEQREGRILRQGNFFYEEDPDGFEVEINRYATKQTYDSRMWQTIEYKAGAIEQFRKGEGLSRIIEDVAGEAAHAAEMKAAATGNPLILLQVQLTAELKKLEALYANYKRNRHTLESTAAWLKQADERANHVIALYQQDIQRRDMNTTQEWRMQVEQRTFNVQNKELLIEWISKSMQCAVEGGAQLLTDQPRTVHVGQYRGFDIAVLSVQERIRFRVKSDNTYEPTNLQYRKEDQFSVTGFVQRMDHFLDTFEESIESVRNRCVNEKAELDKVKRELDKPFVQLRELELVRKNASDVMVEMKKMQDDPDYVSTWKPKILESSPSYKNYFSSAIDSPTSEVQKTTAHVISNQQDAEKLAMRFEEIATSKAKEFKLCAALAQRDKSVYTGRIVAATDHYLIQDIGLGRGILHRLDEVVFAENVKVGECMRLSYKGGRAFVIHLPLSCALTR
nr:hypothetical protein [Candidatus Glomeribacter gigasporarum]